MLDHSCQVQRHPHAERGLDLYETPSVAVEALLRVEQLPHSIWEPAAGRGAIVRVLRNHSHNVVASDVHDALELAPLVIMLLRLAFLESERRCHILENRGLARVHVFRKRLPMMHRDQWAGRKANSGMAFMWATWIRGYNSGPTIINRISWER